MRHKCHFCRHSAGVICAGIFWNLSSKDNLKQKLARETLTDLTDKILIPLSGGGGDTNEVQQTPSEAEIFYNTTGCLRWTSLICPIHFVVWTPPPPPLRGNVFLPCSPLLIFFCHDRIWELISVTCSDMCHISWQLLQRLPHPSLLLFFFKAPASLQPSAFSCFGSTLFVWRRRCFISKLFTMRGIFPLLPEWCVMVKLKL